MHGPPALPSGHTHPNLFTDLDETNLVEVLVAVAEACDASSVNLRLDLSCDGPVIVPGPPPSWARALAELIANAVAEGPAGAEVLVRLCRSDDGAVLSVADHGAGIAPDGFAPYYERPALGGIRRLLGEWGGGKIAISSGGARPGTRIDVTIHEGSTEKPQAARPMA